MGESDLVGYYTSRYSGEEIDRRLGNAAAPVSNPNLLDNWYFIGGGSQLGGGALPINQRGEVSYSKTATGKQYCIDRWWHYKPCTVTLVSSGLQITGDSTIEQNINPEIVTALAGHRVTLSVLYSSEGTVRLETTSGIFVTQHTSTPSKGVHLSITNADVGANLGGVYVEVFFYKDSVVHALKLEVGPVQTLAHQDAAGNWVLNDPPPNYALEMIKCQRYYERLGLYPSLTRIFNFTSSLQSMNSLNVTIPFQTQKRATPVVRFGYDVFDGPEQIEVANVVTSTFFGNYGSIGIQPGEWVDINWYEADANL